MPLPGHDWVKQKWKVMHSEGLPSYHIAVSLTVLLPAGSSKENETLSPSLLGQGDGLPCQCPHLCASLRRLTC